MGESAENRYGLGKLHYVLPSQSTDYVGLTSQVRVQQENHDPTWLIQWLKKLLKCLPIFERLRCYGMMM